jgi:hypothetical protein
MSAIMIVPQYIRWHYSRAIADYWRLTATLLWFFFYFFSIGLLLRTLFAPWRRLDEDGGIWFERVIVNTLMRGVGAIMRTIVILFGLIVLIGTGFLSLLFFIIWLLLPLFVLALLVQGIATLFSLPLIA